MCSLMTQATSYASRRSESLREYLQGCFISRVNVHVMTHLRGIFWQVEARQRKNIAATQLQAHLLGWIARQDVAYRLHCQVIQSMAALMGSSKRVMAHKQGQEQYMLLCKAHHNWHTNTRLETKIRRLKRQQSKEMAAMRFIFVWLQVHVKRCSLKVVLR